MFGVREREQVAAYFVFVLDRILVAKCHTAVLEHIEDGGI